MVVAAANWKLREVASEQAFYAHLQEIVEKAHAAGAETLVLPELPVLELLHLLPASAKTREQVRFMLSHAEPYEQKVADLSASSGLTIVAGSHLREFEGRILNVSLTINPRGDACFQPKNVMTRWEADEWGLSGSNNIVSLPNEFMGTLVCYDVEFPEAARAQAERGVLALCVPSYTETRRGFQRVRWCAQARATENQVFVIHTALVGSLGREPVPSTYGSSAILTPSVDPFPESAILAETELGEEGLAVAQIDMFQLLCARNQGDVRNWNDRNASQWRVVG